MTPQPINYTAVYSDGVLVALYKRFPENKWRDDVATLSMRQCIHNLNSMGQMNIVKKDGEDLIDFVLPLECDPVTP